MDETTTGELVTTGERMEFSPEVIKRRGFVRAKYWSWDEPRNGLITFAGKEFLRVLFLTGVNMAASYFPVKISEVKAGLWQLTYTPDLETFYTINGEEADSDIDLISGVRKLFTEE